MHVSWGKEMHAVDILMSNGGDIGYKEPKNALVLDRCFQYPFILKLESTHPSKSKNDSL